MLNISGRFSCRHFEIIAADNEFIAADIQLSNGLIGIVLTAQGISNATSA